MSSTSDPPKNTPSQYALNVKTLTVGGEVGCLTLLIVLGAVFGGLWLDNLFGTKPLLTIMFVLASAPVSLFLTFWIAKRAAEGMSTLPPAEIKTTSTKEGDVDR